MMNFRKQAFWIKDRLTGNKVRKHYLDIKNGINKPINEDDLNALLKHAIKNTGFYSELDNDSALTDFPVINKNTIKQNFDGFLAKNYKNKKLHVMSTSGSTGTPLKSYQDKRKRSRVIAEIIIFNKLAKQEFGEKFIFFRVWNDQNKKSLLVRKLQNIECINILKLNKDVFEDTLKTLEHKKPSSCLGYASTYEHLLNYVVKNDINTNFPKLKSIITGSEVMQIDLKKRFKQKFKCNVYDRYSNQENGIIAQTKDCSELFMVNHPSYLVEILKEDSDDLAVEGEVGRIVITDLFNYAMPFIRYDTGDLAIRVGNERFSKHIKSVQGRQVDVIYNTSGETLTPHTLNVYMWKFNKLNQYQFIQESKNEYTLKVSDPDNNYSDEDFIEHLKSIFGNDAKIHIEYVDNIPVLSSGKFKKTICNYKP